MSKSSLGYVLMAVGAVLLIVGRLTHRRLIRRWQGEGLTASEFTANRGLAWLSGGVVGVTGGALLIIGFWLSLA
ncbi:MAG TPA: hypothetical protein VFT62_07025 [Mycobacteriales bacterium]|nr:hypothetical protein [Mycobacteriales bacterium]